MRLVTREFRDAPVVWGGVAIVVLIAQIVLSVVFAMLSSTFIQQQLPGMKKKATVVHDTLIITLFFLMAAIVVVVLQIVTTAINQRRRSLALLLIQGMTPWQLTMLTCVRVLLIEGVAALGSLVVIEPVTTIVYPLVTSVIYVGRQPLYLNQIWWAWGAALVVGCVIVLCATLPTLRVMSRLEPVEALRQEVPVHRKLRLPRRLGFFLVLICAVLLYVIPVVTATPLSPRQVASLNSGEVLAPLVGALTIAPVLMACAVSIGGQFVLTFVTSLWTSLIRIPWVPWKIACRQAKDHTQRMSSIMIPLIVGVMLLTTIDGYYRVGAASSTVLPGNISIESASISTLLTLLGPALVVALAGVGAGYLIASRGQGMDLALLSISGSTSRQENAVAVLDGFITVTTSMIVAFGTSLVSMFVYVIGLRRLLGASIFTVPWSTWISLYVVFTLIGMFLSWATVQKSIMRPAITTLTQYVQ